MPCDHCGGDGQRLCQFKIPARVAKLLQKTTEFGQGELSARIDDTGRDEIGRMKPLMIWQRPSPNQNDLSDVNKNPEAIVSQRTDEFQSANF